MSGPRKYKSIKEIEEIYLPKCFNKRMLIEIEDPQAIGRRMAEDNFDKVKDKFLQAR